MKAFVQNIANFSVGIFLLKNGLLFVPVALTTPKNLLCFALIKERRKV